MKFLPANKFGFTVIEALIAVVISSIIMLVATALYVQSGQTTMIVKDRSTATYAVQEAIERLVDDVRNSDGFEDVSGESFVIVTKGDKAEYVFDKNKGTIQKNGAVYSSGLTDFSISYLTLRGAETTIATQAARMTLSVAVTENDVTKIIDTSVIIRRKTL